MVFFNGHLSWKPAARSQSRSDFHRCSHGNQFPNLLDFRIGYGYTTISPICLPVQRSQKSELPGQTVNHDVTSRTDSHFSRAFPVFHLRIRDVQSKMKLAMGILGIDKVIAFGSLMIAVFLFGTDGDRPKR